MAEYKDLWAIRTDSNLRDKIAFAAAVKAQSLLDGTPNSAAIAWANEAIENPVAVADALMYYVLAKNKDLTVTQIVQAGDLAIQTNVDSAVDALLSGGV